MLVALALPAGPLAAQRTLRVCADPNNLPFSSRRLDGFENRIAAVVARELGARVAYVWWPQRRGFLRSTLDAGRCDVVIGTSAELDAVLATRPYYRSTYVFVTRADARPVRSFGDSSLRARRIGVHFTGAGGNPPPAEALARHGLAENLVGFSIYGDYREPHPPARLIDAVTSGEVDVAVAWGPLAGYFAQPGRARTALRLVPVPATDESPGLPMTFAIAMGVRRGDTALRDELQRALDRRAPEIRAILERFGVPLVDDPPRGATR